jgi:hypothetical protein
MQVTLTAEQTITMNRTFNRGQRFGFYQTRAIAEQLVDHIPAWMNKPEGWFWLVDAALADRKVGDGPFDAWVRNNEYVGKGGFVVRDAVEVKFWHPDSVWTPGARWTRLARMTL